MIALTLDRLYGATVQTTRDWFARDTVTVAKDLLGAVLINEETAGTIVETEAYLGGDDLAAHSARGKTDRTKAIFEDPGRAYVYFIYGMHECLNVVAEPYGTPGCVLIRALEPILGLAEMAERRRWHGPNIGLANGPGKLTKALGITRSHYGHDLTTGNLQIRLWRQKPPFQIEATSRIGIRKCADWPLRFVWSGHPCLSKPQVTR